MAQLGTVLLVDDESYVRDSLSILLQRKGYRVRTAAGVREALQSNLLDGLDAIVTDLKMPGQSGLDLLRQIKDRKPGLPVIVLTAFGNVPSAVECIKAGAFEFLEKPADSEELTQTLERALVQSRQQRELEYLRSQGEPSDGPIGQSRAWKEVVSLVEAAGPSDSSILLLGESGVGKEEVAKLIHKRSLRNKRPFVSVNCAAIPLELFESEFFGHCKGAFTGATRDREGRFKVAHGGTLFLDEIGCLPESAQTKVLRVLEEGVFERVGETRSTSVDIRLITATNSDLEKDMDSGRFRRDLYYRINVFTIRIPPLRERREDVPLLASAFLREFASKAGKEILRLEQSALNDLINYDWPGNVRELRNVIERAVILEKGRELRPSSIPENIRSRDEGLGALELEFNLRSALQHEEKRVLENALRASQGVRREAAKLLGIDERNLSYYLKKHDLSKWKPSS